MIIGPATKEQLTSWRTIYAQFKDKLTPNKKSGALVLEYIKSNYPLQELFDEKELK